MIDEIYNRKILFFAGNIERIGVLEPADASAKAYSRVCGSTVTIYLKMDGDRVVDFAHEVKACALGQASSSIMARQIMGATVTELRRVQIEMRNMLSGAGEPPTGRFADLECLLPVREHRARHPSVMLTFDAVNQALDDLEQAPLAPA
ncbi:iron-sulfur cluster assembly scaffold protein [Limoniibacter endophyticus]|nr:iron-sulfur cluster assembly scaffold protein [Limoniibacter endophyticus]